jgi:hypothetical protein
VAEQANAGQSSSQQDGQSQSTGAAAAGSSAQTTGSQAGTGQQAQNNGQQAQQAQQSQQSQWARPSWAPESVKDQAGLDTWANEMVARAAADEVRRNTLPKSADEYKIELPKDFKPPEGIQFTFDQNDPVLKQARELAHTAGWDQDTFAKALGLYAGSRVTELQQVKQAREAELGKLGPTAPARVDSVVTWAKAKLGEELGGAFASMLVTAKHVEMAEKLVTMFASQGSANFSQSHRVPPDGGDITGYEKMTFEQRRQAQDIAASRMNGR